MDALDRRRWTQAEFAEILGRPAQFVSEIIGGKKEITRESASQIGAALNTSAEIWLNLQDSYFLWKQRQDESTQRDLSEVRLRARLNELAPMAVLRKRKIITSTTTAGQVDEIKRLFKLQDIYEQPQLRIAARRSNDGAPLTSTQNAWLACVERALPPPPTVEYSPNKLENLARNISRMVRDPAGLSTLPGAYAEVGVRLVYVEAFPSSRLSGASFLLDDGPVIALSGLRHRLDIVLFTLLHETAHVFRGDLEKHGGSIIDDEDEPHTLGDESKADELASQWILPEDMPPLPNRIGHSWVQSAADRMGVHPMIIIGRLQRSGDLPWRSTLVKNAPTALPYLQTW